MNRLKRFAIYADRLPSWSPPPPSDSRFFDIATGIHFGVARSVKTISTLLYALRSECFFETCIPIWLLAAARKQSTRCM